MASENEMAADDKRRREIHHYLSAYHECLEAIAHGRSRTDEATSGELSRILHDCADICLITANALVRDSSYAPRLAWLAGDIASAAADKCGAIDDDPHFKVCYAAVLRAAMTSLRIAGVADEEEHDDERLRDWIVQGSFPASDPPPGPAHL